MPDLAQPSGAFAERARRALADEHLQGALDAGTWRLAEALREQGRQIRTRTIADLDRHLSAFTDALEACGGHVAFCRTAEEANAYVADVCRRGGGRAAGRADTAVGGGMRPKN